MIAKISAALALVGTIGGGVYFMEGHYLTTPVADNVYVRQDTYQQSVKDQRRWQLQDKVDSIEDRAIDEGRNLTAREQQTIKKLKRKIEELK